MMPSLRLTLVAIAFSVLSGILSAAGLHFPVIKPLDAVNLTKENLNLNLNGADLPLAVEDCMYTYNSTKTWYANFGWHDEKQTGLMAEKGPVGAAVKFTTGYARTLVSDTGLGGPEWTISLWVRPDERDYTARTKIGETEGYFPMKSTILAFMGETPRDVVFALRLCRLRPEVQIGNWVGWTDQRLPLGQWSFLSVVRDTKGMTVFVNGKPSRWEEPLKVDLELGLDLASEGKSPDSPPAVGPGVKELYLGAMLTKKGEEVMVKMADKLIGAVSDLRIQSSALLQPAIARLWEEGKGEAAKLARKISVLSDPTFGAVGRRPDKVGESPEEYRKRLQWFRDAKLGMFLHWGMASINKGDLSWSRGKGEGKTPPEVYDNYYKEFDPQNYDPEKWAAQMKDAGFRYAVLTTKHHDGFCLWPTDTTKYNITATPYGKDVVGPYVKALREAGLGVGFYFSWPDWPFEEKNQPEGMDPLVARENRTNWDIAQLKELATRFGPINLFWFDAGGVFKDITPLQPDAVVNDRVYRPKSPGGNDLVPYNNGDYYTPENYVADFPYVNPDGTDTPWEMCSAMSGSWGYSEDKPRETPESIIRQLSRVAGMGGSWLLNVAPRRDGTLPEGPMNVLSAVGKYLRENGEAFYGTHRTRLGQQKFGFSTASDSALYLHVHKWPKEGVIEVEDVQDSPSSVTLLQSGTPLKFSHMNGVLYVELPANAPVGPLPIIKAIFKSL